MAFAEVEDLAAFLHMDPSLLEDDEGAAMALDAAEVIIKTYTKQDIEETSETVYIDGPRNSALLLPQLPVTTVTTVTEDGTSLTVSEEYFLDDEHGVLYRCSGDRYSPVYWSQGTLNIAVTYTHGYETIPADVKLVTCSAAGRIFDHAGVTQETASGYSASYDSASVFLSAGERAVLDRYRVGA
jgi:hypothetical protein